MSIILLSRSLRAMQVNKSRLVKRLRKMSLTTQKRVLSALAGPFRGAHQRGDGHAVLVGK